jgi:hypothetical protein
VSTATWLGLALFARCYLLLRSEAPQSSIANSFLSAAFGLVHGFGFAAVLIDMSLANDRLLAALFGFNFGVEIGQLVVVAAAWSLMRALRSAFAPRARLALRAATSAALCGLGVYWMLVRSLGA